MRVNWAWFCGKRTADCRLILYRAHIPPFFSVCTWTPERQGVRFDGLLEQGGVRFDFGGDRGHVPSQGARLNSCCVVPSRSGHYMSAHTKVASVGSQNSQIQQVVCSALASTAATAVDVGGNGRGVPNFPCQSFSRLQQSPSPVLLRVLASTPSKWACFVPPTRCQGLTLPQAAACPASTVYLADQSSAITPLKDFFLSCVPSPFRRASSSSPPSLSIAVQEKDGKVTIHAANIGDRCGDSTAF